MRISDWSSDVCSSDFEDGDARRRRRIEHPCLERAGRPALAPPRVRHPGLDDAGVGAVRRTEAPDGRQVALQVAAGDAEAGREVAVGADPPVQLQRRRDLRPVGTDMLAEFGHRSEEHTSELQALMRSSYAVFRLKKKT